MIGREDIAALLAQQQMAEQPPADPALIQMAMAPKTELTNPRPGQMPQQMGGGGVAPMPDRRQFLETRIRQIQADRNYRRKLGEDVEGEMFAPGRNMLRQMREELKLLKGE